MTNFSDLPKFAETMTNLAAYLIAAPAKHARHILGDPEEGTSDSRSSIKMRVTQHYTAALLAYGIPIGEPEMIRATEWFATPFPGDTQGMIDTIEMTKLEGLLNLRPEDPTVYPRLRQLVAQRTQHFFEIDRTEAQGPPAQVFDTLWSLKLLMLAREKGVLSNLIQDDEIQECITQIGSIVIEDKDLALVLRLQYDLTQKLEPYQEDYIQQVIDQAKKYRNIWGIRSNRWKNIQDIVEAMHRQQLTPGIIGTETRNFREAILNTCYVIENLMPLTHQYPQLGTYVQDAMLLWWQQFHGTNAIHSIRTLFNDEDPYDFLMVLCRTMVTVREYVGEPPGALCWVPSLRDTSEKFNTNEWPEMVSIEQALRRWIKMEIPNPERLKLGLSGADVLRIEPALYNPTDESRTDLLRETLIVKYGPVEEIDQERSNYRQLPTRILNHFVRIPEESYINEHRQAFVIMQDLNAYHTLYENFDKLLNSDRPRVVRLLIDFLLMMHQGDGEPARTSNNNHLRDLYILPMLHHIDQIITQAERAHYRELVSNEEFERIEAVEGKINDLLGGIMQRQRKIRHFPLAYMHGDLHSRNIMIQRISKHRSLNGRTEFRFKLIDLESLRPDGDAAHDAGQLLVDLALLRVNGANRLSKAITENLLYFQDQIHEQYLAHAKQQGDVHFSTRLELAQARAMLRVAKSMAKRSGKAMNSREPQQAFDYISEALNLAEGASQYLISADKSITDGTIGSETPMS